MATFEEIRDLPIIQLALDDLKCHLPQNFSYHSIEHTKNVMKTVYDLAVADNLSSRKVELLVVAAAYHDWGYLERSRRNEPIGARKAIWEMIKSGGYSLGEMIGVARAILATALEKNKNDVMVQNPRTELGKYLCDADLSSFGRTSFFLDSLNVLREIGGPNISNGAELLDNNDKVLPFLKSTLTMMKAHQYQTKAAKDAFNEQKETNVKNLSDLVRAVKGNNTEDVSRIFSSMTNT